MGVSSGIRVIINDKLKDDDKDSAIAINLTTDSGFENFHSLFHMLQVNVVYLLY